MGLVYIYVDGKGGSRGMAQDIGLSVDRVASAVGILVPAVQRHF